ncbi:MAG: YwaF family protein [Bacilli bacterium]|nr:YwaF family protein [Bacilli bacterium]
MLFFSPKGVGEICGMFTLPHLMALMVCILLIILGVHLTLKIDEKKVYQVVRATAILVTILEIMKIVYNFYYGYTNLDSWFPLAYCSLFIYSTWMVGYGNKKLKKIGSSFLVGGGIMAGLAFLIFPTTSLMMCPLYHFLSFHSLIFHSLMVFIGIMCYNNNVFKFSKKGYISYITFCLIFMVLALIVNMLGDCNMMFLKEPFNIPIPILKTIREKSQIIYSLIIMIVYLTIPYGIMNMIDRLLNRGENHV